ncbi:MAG: ABC transporter ATP-binding protein [Chromatiaceae bacterium]|nr:ABC transporter ATP-binding protein [Chromatiaceae bacterium]
MADAKSVTVSFHNVALAFGDHVVLRDIDLDIEAGEFFAFLGPSGSGKSTLLRLLAGFGPTPQGQVLIDGEDVTRLPPWKRRVGMVFQNYALWPHMTVRRNVAFGLEERRLPSAEVRERVDAALDVVGLREYAERRPSQLSGGQQQRVALARTIVVEPRVLLLDEPLSNLDANLRIRMRGEIRELQQRLGITTIFVTHDQEEANTVADRMAVLNDGILQQVGSPMALYDNPANRFVARFLGTANLLDGDITRGASGAALRIAAGFEIPIGQLATDAARATAMFRPQNLAPLSGPPVADSKRVHFPARVRQREFLGNLIRYEIEVHGQALVFDDIHQQGTPTYEVDQIIEMTLDPARVRVLTG